MSTSDAHLFPLGHHAIEAVIASAILTGLAVFLVAIRFYTRRFIINAVQSSDWIVLCSLIFSITFVAIFIAEIMYGMGWHQDERYSVESFIKSKKLFWISIPFYNAAMITAKASIIIQYYHVFPTKKMRLVCWITAAILAMCGVWVVLSAFLNCIPVATFWDPTVPGHCLKDKELWFSNASLNILTDLAILIIPIPALASLDLPIRQKVGLCCVFPLGGFVCITSICRLQSLKALVDSNDQSYHSLAVSLWSAVECNTGIICACLPTLRPAIVRLFPTLSSILLLNHPGQTDTDTSFYDVSAGISELLRRDTYNTTARGLEAGSSSTSSTSKVKTNDMQEVLNVRVIPTPGNAFAQDLLHKGSFFEQHQRPDSYV